MIRTLFTVLAIAIALVRSAVAPAADGSGAAPIADRIEARILDWAEAFNAGQTDRLCDLFAQDLVARVRGEPVRGRQAMCRQFREAAGGDATRMIYAPAVEDVLVGEHLAVATVTWALQVERGVVDTRFTERAQYVFAPDPAGEWRVIRLVSYLEPTDR